MSQTREDRTVTTKSEKRQTYTRPELVRHGKVETLTQLQTNPSTSQPIPD